MYLDSDAKYITLYFLMYVKLFQSFVLEAYFNIINCIKQHKTLRNKSLN